MEGKYRPLLRGEVRVPVYWLLVGIAVMVVSPILSILISVKINERTLAENEAIKRAAQVEGLQRACRLIGAQVEVFDQAESPVGEKAYKAWVQEYRLSQCQPPK